MAGHRGSRPTFRDLKNGLDRACVSVSASMRGGIRHCGRVAAGNQSLKLPSASGVLWLLNSTEANLLRVATGILFHTARAIENKTNTSFFLKPVFTKTLIPTRHKIHHSKARDNIVPREKKYPFFCQTELGFDHIKLPTTTHRASELPSHLADLRAIENSEDLRRRSKPAENEILCCC